MIKHICPYCDKESKFITWDKENVKCTNCEKIFHYLKILYTITKD